jgi:hypothetical protein
MLVSLRLCKNMILSHHVCIAFSPKQPIVMFKLTIVEVRAG